MIKKNNKGMLIIVSGPSGTGKDSICNSVKNEMDNIGKTNIIS